MILILLSTLVLLYLFNNFYWKRRHLPPGPLPLPIIGNVFSLASSQPPQKLIEWRKKYGDIYTYWLGEQAVVAVNDINTINDKFVKDGDTFAGRPLENTQMQELIKNGRNGIIFNDGTVWRDLRRFSLHVLRDFGVGRNVMQEKILDEVVITINSIKKDKAQSKGQPQNIQQHIDIAVGSIIMQLIFGYRYTASSSTRDEFYVYKKLLDEITRTLGSFAGLVLQKHTHRYKHFPYLGSKYARLHEIKLKLFTLCERNIEQRRPEIDFDSDTESTDFVEAFLRKQHELKSKGEQTDVFTDAHLSSTLLDMWFAGQETTSSTLGWTCIYINNNPHVQEKIHAELDTVISSDRLVTNEDKPRLHYLNAVVTESQRVCNLLANNVLHRNVKDVEVHGYLIPKDTVIVDQLSTVLYDEQLFPEPLKFKPERHLDENNNFKPHPAVIPFGVGKRSCLGEALARTELFLFTANICNQFKLSSKQPVSEYRCMAVTATPPEVQINIEPRH